VNSGFTGIAHDAISTFGSRSVPLLIIVNGRYRMLVPRSIGGWISGTITVAILAVVPGFFLVAADAAGGRALENYRALHGVHGSVSIADCFPDRHGPFVSDDDRLHIADVRPAGARRTLKRQLPRRCLRSKVDSGSCPVDEEERAESTAPTCPET
jgi:hypothetical protein